MTGQNPPEVEPEPQNIDEAREEQAPASDEAIEEEAARESDFADDPETTDEESIGDTTQAVLWASDWTTETILAQLGRGNIELSPRFGNYILDEPILRVDGWKRQAGDLLMKLR